MNTEAQEKRHEAAELSARAARLRDEARRIEKSAREAARPKMPPVDDTAVHVIFTKYESGRIYSYGAVGWRVDNQIRWAITGGETRRFNWPGLLSWIGETNWASIEQVSASQPLIGPDDEPPAAETIGSYGKVTHIGSPTAKLVEPVEPYHGRTGSTDSYRPEW